MLDPIQSRARQERLLAQMQERKLDAIVIALPWHVYYLSAHLTHMLHQSGMIIFSDGRSWLATANEPATNVAADEVVAFEAQWMATLRQEQPELVADMVIDQLKARGAKRIGIDCSQVTAVVASKLTTDVTPIDPLLWQLRRVKDRDELE